jgi:hypothetical protein
MNIIRSAVLLIGAGAGVWGSHRLLEMVARQAGGSHSHFSPEMTPVVIPVTIVGALVGAFLSGLLLPPRR